MSPAELGGENGMVGELWDEVLFIESTWLPTAISYIFFKWIACQDVFKANQYADT